MHKLVTDGRIHPARVEEVVKKTEKQIQQEIIEVGKRTVIDLGIHGLRPELIKTVGRMISFVLWAEPTSAFKRSSKPVWSYGIRVRT